MPASWGGENYRLMQLAGRYFPEHKCVTSAL
jgi:hypothetical protein